MFETFKDMLSSLKGKSTDEKKTFYYYDPNCKPNPANSTLNVTDKKVAPKEKTSPAKETTSVVPAQDKKTDPKKLKAECEIHDWDNYNFDYYGVGFNPSEISGKSKKPFEATDPIKKGTNESVKFGTYKPKIIIPAVKLKILSINLEAFSMISDEDKVDYLVAGLGLSRKQKISSTIIILVDIASLRVFEFEKISDVNSLCKEISKLDIINTGKNQVYDLICSVDKKCAEIAKTNLFTLNDKKFDVKSGMDLVIVSSPEDVGSASKPEDAKSSISSLRKIAGTKFICINEQNLTLPAMLGFREVSSLERTF